MYKTRKKILFIIVDACVLLLSVIMSVFLVRGNVPDTDVAVLMETSTCVFLAFLVIASSLHRAVDKYLKKNFAIPMMTYIKLFQKRLKFRLTVLFFL